MSAAAPSRSGSPTWTTEFRDALSMFRATVSWGSSRTMIRYFDGELTFLAVDEQSDALACALSDFGVGSGDRVVMIAQNIPHFLIAILACWKVGAVIVPVTPMLSDHELQHIVDDSGATVVLCEESRLGDWTERLDLTAAVVSVCPHEYSDAAAASTVIPAHRPLREGSVGFGDLLRQNRGRSPDSLVPAPESAAAITYTSGTTGLPKGAVNRHESVAFVGQVYRDWVPLTRDDRVLGAAPLSTIIGIAVEVSSVILSGSSLVIGYRFESASFADLIRRQRPTFLVAAPTLFTAILNSDEFAAEDVARIVHLYCGAAPVPPVLVERWRARFGSELRTVYGMTEATGPTHLAPLRVEIPTDPITGALSIGVPVFATECRVVDPSGSIEDVVPEGEAGEMVIRGPQIIHEYWRNAAATQKAIVDGWIRTGDLVTRHGDWIFVVDRLKDIIITSGNNVSPRQVEECLLTHPSVRQAAVVGVPDEYRGESVVAFVVLAPEAAPDPAALVQHCRHFLAHYKAPRRIEFVEDLPKNPAGKILRRELRERATAG